MTPRILSVIPARGGSKGIPRKNLVPVAGHPLLHWTVAAALRSRYAASGHLTVAVSTEDAEIAAAARGFGARVIERPAELAEDTTPTEPVVRHAVESASAAGERPDAVLLLQATSPVRLPDTIDRAIAQFASTGVDSLVGVVPTPIYLWAPGPTPTDPPVAHYPWQARPRRQDLAPEQLRYRETGSLYLSRTALYAHPDPSADNRLGGTIGMFVMDEVEGTDIDTPLDLAVADALLTRLVAERRVAVPAEAEEPQ